ncbi:MAG: hypothetical protein MUD14_24515 [Hydrococcus sp. Prado102]|nr:hypothetical protein [Hydrococcus sp. Prado102]
MSFTHFQKTKHFTKRFRRQLHVWVLILVFTSFCYLETSQIVLAESLTNPNNSPAAEVIEAVRQDLSNRTNLESDRFKLVKSNQKTWPDGCLGLPRSDEMCTQALVEGWQIVIESGDRTWIYRTDARGRTIRLESEK